MEITERLHTLLLYKAAAVLCAGKDSSDCITLRSRLADQ